MRTRKCNEGKMSISGVEGSSFWKVNGRKNING